MGFYPKNNVPGQFPTLDDTALKTVADAAQADAVTRVTGVYAKFSQTPPVFTPNGEDGTTGYGHNVPGLNLNIYYFHPDHLGSSAYISNAAGVVTQHMEYLPFGETLTDEHTNSFNSPFKYNGKEFDEETGNYYYGARYYDPKWSIFISVDPLAEQTMDAYGYCYNNPINFTDPTGMAAGDGDDIIKIGLNGGLNITKAEGDDIVQLVDYKNGGEVVSSYVYGENGSFLEDASVDTSLRDGYNIHFTNSDPEKANKFFEFAAKSKIEFSLLEVFYANSLFAESIVSTQFSGWGVSGSSDAAEILSKNKDAIITRVRHSHPGGYVKTFGPGAPGPSGFDNYLKPDNYTRGDRINYINKKKEFGDRLPQYFEVYYAHGSLNFKYNGEKAFSNKK